MSAAARMFIRVTRLEEWDLQAIQADLTCILNCAVIFMVRLILGISCSNFFTNLLNQASPAEEVLLLFSSLPEV